MRMKILKNNLPKERKIESLDYKQVFLGLNKLQEYYALLQETYFYEDLSCFGKYIISHPILQWILLGVVTTLFTPFFLFVIFTIVNAIFAFIGFMWIQVAVLAIGISIFGCILFWVVTALSMIGLSIFCTYYVLRYMSQFFKTIIFN